MFPGSQHVATLHLSQVPDVEVWLYARAHDFVIVSKDADFGEMSVLRGFPPKVIWLQFGNCATNAIENILRSHAASIVQLENDVESGILILRR